MSKQQEQTLTYFNASAADWQEKALGKKVKVNVIEKRNNAVLAALQILSARNPRIYAHVRGEIENRTVNTIPL